MSRPSAADAGSAVVDFVLVAALTTVLFAGVLQLTLALHVRSTLVDCAAEGARYGALADRGPADAERRTRELITMTLAPRFADDVVAEATTVEGLPVVRVQVTAALPVLGPLGPAGSLVVDGHALEELP
ncbi:pilus assembly protein [Actinotalea ferrariae]|uniref:TadE family protein n=1 Tax=Actinotalea ferrariae TaxID=1386098 RepID=UPI001C8BBF6C|nr:TadE family protein [Actinotalea ferrariae]MBX9243566.1 pilus assembly protein [Actinotalea ferrariae]